MSARAPFALLLFATGCASSSAHAPAALPSTSSVRRAPLATTAPSEPAQVPQTDSSPPELAPLLARARDLHQSLAARTGAVAALGKLGQPAVPALETLLSAPEPPVRQAAAAALGALGGPRARDSVVAQLEREEDFQVREALERSLAQMEP